MDFLMREDAPLSPQEWQAIDDTVVRVARANLVARRFLHLYGPLGAGAQAVFVDRLEGVTPGRTSVYGEECDNAEVAPTQRHMIPLNLLYKDFKLFWRDIAASRATGSPVDVAPAGAAAAMLARAEDQLVFYGTEQEPGLMKQPGRAETAKLSGWAEPGSGLATVVAARQALVTGGAMGPYALVLSPDLYAQLLRMLGGRGRLELELVQQIADAGVFQTPVLGPGEGVLVSTGPEILDLAVAEDMQVAYLGPTNMNHTLRIFESIALRVRQPQGICVLV